MEHCLFGRKSDSVSKAILDSKIKLPNPVKEKLVKLLTEVCRHTDVIDCGEKPADTNRVLWDALEPFHEIIYGILGTLA